MIETFTARLVHASLISVVMLVGTASLPAIAAQSDRVSYVLLDAGDRSATMSGSTDDLRRARALRAGREPLFYMRRGGNAYIIRDAAWLRQANALFEPQKAQGARQATLGSRQAALGAEQARLGMQQVGALPSRRDELDRQQDALGRRQDELGRQQDALGREQDRLGREADAKLAAMFEDALRSGIAQRVD